MDRVVFACRHNAGRSQMAAAFFARAADADRAQAVSAGTTPAERVHPEVAEVMRSGGRPVVRAAPAADSELAAGASLLVTMGCGEDVRWSRGRGAGLAPRRPQGPARGARARDPRRDPTARGGPRQARGRGWRRGGAYTHGQQ